MDNASADLRSLLDRRSGSPAQNSAATTPASPTAVTRLPVKARVGSIGMRRLIKGMARSLDGTPAIERQKETRIVVQFPYLHP
jgi:hypothetical protein